MDNWKEISLAGIDQDIKDLVYGYIQAQSFTHSPGEKDAESFFLNYFHQQPYWQDNPQFCGSFPIEDDPFHRAAAFAMVKGQGPNTIVFVHHNDIVPVEDYKLLRPLAFSPDLLEVELKKLRSTFSDEIQHDLDSGAFLYGRGVCDMKGGGAVQMALLSRYAQFVQEHPNDLPGNLIVLAVPDEENLSAGMRAAVLLLSQLKNRFGLSYQLMINSEPHQRKDPETGVFSMGSVGKLMPFFYVRGYLAHVGKVFEGFNPVHLLSAIVRKTELNFAFSDVVGKEAAPPPTWLFCRDQKLSYDVSMPLSAAGCLSVLTLNQTPSTLMERIRPICTEAFQEVLDDMNHSYSCFLQACGQPPRKLPWKEKVVTFSELYQQALDSYGKEFQLGYQKTLTDLKRSLDRDEKSLIECNFQLVEYVFNYIDDLSPQIIFGLIPPYYPNVSNRFLTNLPPSIEHLGEMLTQFTLQEFGQRYSTEEFYTGISDLSYTSLHSSAEIVNTLKETMPFFGNLYHLPVETIEEISMPCINIGPWGKDFHKLTERVLKQDLYERTPRIIQYAISQVLN